MELESPSILLAGTPRARYELNLFVRLLGLTRRTPRRYQWLAFAVVAASVCVLLVNPLDVPLVGDVGLYYRTASTLLDGQVPYQDQALEYPPYAIGLFLLPRAVTALNYGLAFSLFMLLGDLLLKGTLLLALCSREARLRAVAPVVLYAAASAVLAHFYLHRYDVWPALLCLGAVLWAQCGALVLSGFALALGIGLKLYPVVLIPPLLVVAARNGGARRFTLGIFLGLVPLIFLAFFCPWWRFAAIHTARGLQAESLYASILWAGKLCGVWQLRWEEARACKEIHGAAAAFVLPFARALSFGAVLASVTVASYSVAKSVRLTLPRIASLALLPLLGFVIFNPVFSPQYLVWLLPFAVLAILDNYPTPGALIFIATMLTPVFYPSIFHDYSRNGLSISETAVLLLRNLLFVIAWIALVKIHSTSPRACSVEDEFAGNSVA